MLGIKEVPKRRLWGNERKSIRLLALGVIVLWGCSRPVASHAQVMAPVVINEVMPAPTAGSVEFIELYISSETPISWDQMKVRDRTSAWRNVVVEGAPRTGSFIVLVKSIEEATPLFPPETHFGVVSPWPSLNNSGDSLFVELNGTLIEQMGWSHSISGTSWERISPVVPGKIASNWGASIAASGATPGAINSIFALDTAPPRLIGAEFRQPDSLIVWFSEPISSAKPLDIEIQMDGSSFFSTWSDVHLDVASIALPPQVVSSLTRDLESVHVPELKDLSGNVAFSLSAPIYWPPDQHELFISEVLSHAGGTLRSQPIPEFVQITSLSNRPLSLRDITLWVDGSTSQLFSFHQPALLDPFASIVVSHSVWQGWEALQIENVSWFEEHQNDPFLTSYQFHEVTYAPSSTWTTLPNSEASLRLMANEMVIDSTSYADRCRDYRYSNFQGRSWIRKVTALWSADTSPSFFPPDNCDWTNNLFPSGASPGWQMVKTDQTDHIPAPASLTATEILAAPIQDAFDFEPDQTEFIELINTSDQQIPLHRVFLADVPDEFGNQTIWPIAFSPVWLEPLGVAVLFKLPTHWVDEALHEYQLLEAAWPAFSSQVTPDRQVVFIPSRKLPTLNNTTDTHLVLNENGLTIGEIVYQASDHYAGLAETAGHSLFKPLYQGMDGSRPWHFGQWTTSFSAGGATPGWIPNWVRPSESGNEHPLTNQTEFELQVNPTSFYPLHAQLDHQTLVNVKTPSQGAFIRLDVYDSQGYFVTQLGEATFVDQGWTATWDGRTKMGQKVPTGIFLIVATFKNQQGVLLKRLKQPVAVLSP